MLLQCGLFLSVVLSPIYNEMNLDLLEMHPIKTELQEVMTVFYITPARSEFIDYLEGHLIALTPFIDLCGESYKANYRRLLKTFAKYQEQPSTRRSNNIRKKFAKLIEQDIDASIDYKPAMLTALTRLENDLKTIHVTSDEVTFLKIAGQKDILIELAPFVSDPFEEEFEEFDMLFTHFFTHSEENDWGPLFHSLHELQDSLK